MKNQTFNFAVRESSFGGSAAVEVTVDKNGTILFVSDKSTNETNWTWDYIPDMFKRCVGQTMDVFRNMVAKHNNNLLRGPEYRTPHWIEI